MKFTTALKPRLIYVMRINDVAHEGLLKIGEATVDADDIFGLSPNSKDLNKAAKKRINQYTQTAGIFYDLLHTEMAVFIKNKTINGFNDKEVGALLERSGIKKEYFDEERKANEWFYVDLETAKKAITAVKHGRDSLHASEVTDTQLTHCIQTGTKRGH